MPLYRPRERPGSLYIHVVKRKNLWFAITLALIVPSVIALLLFGLKPGLDFRGGTLMELKVPSTVTADAVKDALKDTPIAGALVQMSVAGSDTVALVRAEAVDNAQQVVVFDQLKAGIGQFEAQRVEVVGPAVGQELLWNSLWAMLIVMCGIVAYVTMRFRFDYAVGAIVGMLHDVLILLGVYAVLGRFAGYEVDSLFVTALLTVAGFSVHDKIVVYDRIRENAKLAGPRSAKTFTEIADDSINQTMARSINTSVTTMLPLVALLLFGGESIHSFVLAMLIGVALGTYSSIFVASPFLAVWRERDAAKGRNRSMA